MTQEHTSTTRLFTKHEVARTLFAPRQDDNTILSTARPAIANMSLALLEFPFSMAWTNIKAGMITAHNQFGMRDTASAIYKTGFKNFYAGTQQELFRQLTRQCLIGPCLTTLPAYLKDNFPEDKQWAIPIAQGLITAGIEVTATARFESRRTYQNTAALSFGAVRHFKPFAGYYETLARQFPAWMICCYSLDQAVRNIKAYKKNEVSYSDLFLASPFVVASYILPMHPIDMVKIHKQQMGKSKYGIEEGMSILESLTKIYKCGGVRELWRGAPASVLQRIPTIFTALVLTEWYEKQKENTDSPQTASELMTGFRERVQNSIGGMGRG